MLLRDYLRVPYLLEARLVERAPAVWVNRVSYPELSGCTIESPAIEVALAELEGLRIRTIIEMLENGQTPPQPRPPLESSDPVWAAEQANLPADIIGRIRDNAISRKQAAT